jgi:hypothetical protein
MKTMPWPLSGLSLAGIIFLLTVPESCSPYEPYPYTHYYIQATIEPEIARIAANVQLVFIPRKDYYDSILFYLNPGVEIQSLAAQELQYYEFEGDELRLYIEEPVMRNEQLHISLSYSGVITDRVLEHMDSSLLWYPLNEDIYPSTFHAKFNLAGEWQISEPETGTGKHGKRLYQSLQPRGFLDIVIRNQE